MRIPWKSLSFLHFFSVLSYTFIYLHKRDSASTINVIMFNFCYISFTQLDKVVTIVGRLYVTNLGGLFCLFEASSTPVLLVVYLPQSIFTLFIDCICIGNARGCMLWQTSMSNPAMLVWVQVFARGGRKHVPVIHSPEASWYYPKSALINCVCVCEWGWLHWPFLLEFHNLINGVFIKVLSFRLTIVIKICTTKKAMHLACFTMWL